MGIHIPRNREARVGVLRVEASWVYVDVSGRGVCRVIKEQEFLMVANVDGYVAVRAGRRHAKCDEPK